MGLPLASQWSMALDVGPKVFSGCSEPLSIWIQVSQNLPHTYHISLRQLIGGHKPFRDRLAASVLSSSDSELLVAELKRSESQGFLRDQMKGLGVEQIYR